MAGASSRVALALGQLQTGLAFCGKPVLSLQDDEAVRGQLGKLKTFLESLRPFNSVGRLKNFPHDAATIQKQRPALDALAAIDQLSDLLHRTAQAAAYLLSAETLLPLKHPDGVKIRELRTDWQARMADPAQRRAPGFGTQLEQALESGRQLYKDAYVALHQKARLGPNDDKKKGKLAKDARLKMLRDLASIDLMPTQQFRQLENELLNMKTCYQMSASELDATPY